MMLEMKFHHHSKLFIYRIKLFIIMELRKFIATTIREYLNENVNNGDIVQFLSDKKFINTKSKMFLYHGTSVEPSKFNLRSDYNWEDSNTWSGDLPEGYLFLTTDIKEAKAYGKYVIPCELKYYSHIFFNVSSDNPSKVFDMDYGIDLYTPEKYYNFWQKFEESGKSSLIIKGLNKKWTVITDIYNVIPRIDLATQFYSAIREFLNENVNSDILEELQVIIKKLLITYGLRYINDLDLDKSDGHFSLPKMMTDKRGQVKFDENKLFLYFPLKNEIINTIGKNNFDKYFDYDSSDGYLTFKIRTYKKDGNFVSDFITSRSVKLNVDDVKNFISDLVIFINSLEKKEWRPSQKDLEQGLKDLRNI